MAVDEMRRLDDERPNEPVAIENNKKHRELLQIFANGFEKIATALAALEDSQTKASLIIKAKTVVNNVGNQVNSWFGANGAEVIDWSVRIPFFTAGVAALGWAGADMKVATTAIAAIVGGQKVADFFTRKGKRKR